MKCRCSLTMVMKNEHYSIFTCHSPATQPHRRLHKVCTENINFYSSSIFIHLFLYIAFVQYWVDSSISSWNIFMVIPESHTSKHALMPYLNSNLHYLLSSSNFYVIWMKYMWGNFVFIFSKSALSVNYFVFQQHQVLTSLHSVTD